MKHLFLHVFILFSIVGFAQTDTSNRIVFDDPEIHAQFPGGDKALIDFLQKNIVYPSIQSDTLMPAVKVIVRFTVTEEGKVTDIKIVRGAGKPFDDEAVRVVKLFPDFKPGSLAGKPIKMDFSLPVIFRLPQ